MPSVAGLLEERELAARERVEVLRDEADRVLAVLAEAESDWQEWVIARQRVGEVLSASRTLEPGGADPDQAWESEPAPDPEVPAQVAAPRVARAGSIVPVWRPGLSSAVLAVDYQRILAVLAEHRAGGDGGMTCQEITAVLGLELCPASVEGVRSKMKRLTGRGWTAELSPGRFTLADGPACGS